MVLFFFLVEWVLLNPFFCAIQMQFYSSLSENLSGFIQPHILALQNRRWAPVFVLWQQFFPSWSCSLVSLSAHKCSSKLVLPTKLYQFFIVEFFTICKRGFSSNRGFLLAFSGLAFSCWLSFCMEYLTYNHVTMKFLANLGVQDILNFIFELDMCTAYTRHIFQNLISQLNI